MNEWIEGQQDTDAVCGVWWRWSNSELDERNQVRPVFSSTKHWSRQNFKLTSKATTLLMFASTDDIYENASKVVCNELLCYICCYWDRSNAEALRRAVLTNFSPDDTSSAKKLITHEFQDVVTSTTLMTDRRNTTSRLAHEVEVEDILRLFDELDTKNIVGVYLFVAANMEAVPKYGHEKMNAATVIDRQVNIESNVS